MIILLCQNNLPQSFGDTSSTFYFAMIGFDCWIIIVIYAHCANAHGFAIQILARQFVGGKVALDSTQDFLSHET